MSTKAKTIKLLGKKRPYAFGMRFQKYLMENLGVVTNADYDRKLGLIFSEENDESKFTAPDANVSDLFESYEVVASFIISAVQSAAKEKIALDVYEVMDELQMVGFHHYQELFTVFAEQQAQIIKNTQNALGKSNK
jgi:hypothetical protein